MTRYYDSAEEAIEAAKALSMKDGCTTHVNANVKLVAQGEDGLLFEEVSYTLSDWYSDGATVYTAHKSGRGGFVS